MPFSCRLFATLRTFEYFHSLNRILWLLQLSNNLLILFYIVENQRVERFYSVNEITTQHACCASLLFAFYRLNHRWRSAWRVFVCWIWSSARGDVDVCLVFFYPSFGLQYILIPHKRRHYFQPRVGGGSWTAANKPVLFSFFFLFLFSCFQFGADAPQVWMELQSQRSLRL